MLEVNPHRLLGGANIEEADSTIFASARRSLEALSRPSHPCSWFRENSLRTPRGSSSNPSIDSAVEHSRGLADAEKSELLTVPLSSGRARTFRGLGSSFLLARYERENGIHRSIAIVSSRFDL